MMAVVCQSITSLYVLDRWVQYSKIRSGCVTILIKRVHSFFATSRLATVPVMDDGWSISRCGNNVDYYSRMRLKLHGMYVWSIVYIIRACIIITWLLLLYAIKLVN